MADGQWESREQREGVVSHARVEKSSLILIPIFVQAMIHTRAAPVILRRDSHRKIAANVTSAGEGRQNRSIRDATM